MGKIVHVKSIEAGGAKGMSAVNHDSRDVIDAVVILFAEETFVFVE